MRKIRENTTGIAPRLLSATELAAYLGLGRGSAVRFAEAAGARVTFGRRVVFDRQKIDKALDVRNDSLPE